MRQQLLRHCLCAVFLFVCPVWIPMLIIFVLKFVGGMFTRFVLSTVYKKDFENE